MSAAAELASAVAGLDPERLAALYGKSLLLTSEWTLAELETLCEVAAVFERLDRAAVRLPLFPEELHLAAFFDASTRTKSSWAGAAARLGARPLIVDGATTQVSHGETAEETGAMLGMNAHALGFRHDLILGEGHAFMQRAKKGIDDYLAATGDRREVPVINLQCDVDHPTQTLADLCWLQDRFPEGLAGKVVTVSWAYSPSYAKPLSVPQGLITLLTRFGAEVRLARPPGYELLADCERSAEDFALDSGGRFVLYDSMDEAFAEADVVYPKSWGPYELMVERVKAHRDGDQALMKEIEQRALGHNEAHTDWICNRERMAATRSGQALYLHCLPADIGAEVSAEVMERFRVDLARQANKKVYVIMAALAASKAPDLRERLAEIVESDR